MTASSTSPDAVSGPPDDGRDPPGRPENRRHRLRRLGAAAVVVAVFVTIVAFMARTPSPVGHWASAEGQDIYMDAYENAMSDLPEPAETLDVRTEYGVVRVYRFEGGNEAGAPLVLIPGRSSASPVWADNLPGLLSLSDVYTIDLLGEPGMSVQQRPITSDADQAAWLSQTLAGLPETSFHLIGLSIGGWSAANLALHDDSSIETLTLVEPVQVFDDIPVETAIRSLPAAVPWLPKAWRDGFNSYTAGGAPVEDVPVAQMIEAGMQHYVMRLPQPTRITEQRLSGVDVPSLVVIAGESVMLDPGVAVEMAETVLPGATVRLYPDASHAVNGEYPDQLVTDIGDFLTAQ